MVQWTSEGEAALAQVAARYGVSLDAARSMAHAVAAGGGSMAQFNVPELGGMGQWMQGGMTMVGDMFNHNLKSRVDGLCLELSQMLGRPNFIAPPPQAQGSGYGGWGNWWPQELGWPTASGGQNNMRYAYFAGIRRLAVDIGGHVTVYDTGDHSIGGVSQQQSGGFSGLAFTSQMGTVDVASLPIVARS